MNVINIMHYECLQFERKQVLLLNCHVKNDGKWTLSKYRKLDVCCLCKQMLMRIAYLHEWMVSHK